MSDVFRAHVTPGQTPQIEQARADQVKNNAGGYTFKVGDKERLNRFLTIGTEGGTYYQQEKPLTRENAKFVMALAEGNVKLLLDETLAVSDSGRAPRNNPALFANAAAAGLGNQNFRQQALDQMPLIARTGSHLLAWAEYIEMFRGWGPQLTKGVGKWYTSKSPNDLAYQLLKYKQRNGWSQRDLMRLSHFGRQELTAEQKAVFAYFMKGTFDAEHLPYLVDVAEQAHDTRNVANWVRLIAANKSLSWEMLPSEALAEKAVWEALITGGNLPLTALLRNLARITGLGVVGPLSQFNHIVTERLTDINAILKARIHPIAVLTALKTYAMGHSMRGKSEWKPVGQIIEALDKMFYLAFGTVRSSGKRTLICTDVSGSMGWQIKGPDGKLIYPFTAAEIVGAMAMVTMKNEPEYAVMGFAHELRPLPLHAGMSLNEVMHTMQVNTFGGTDCSVPMLWAQANALGVDNFQVWTDNETYFGQMHPHEALKRYRRFSGIEATMQVIAVAPTNFSIADPLDAGQLDVSGFDSAVPNLLADHSAGML